MGGRGCGACLAAGRDGAIVWGKLYCFRDVFCANAWDVHAVTSVVFRGGSKVLSIYTVGGPGAAVVGCLVYYDLRTWMC